MHKIKGYWSKFVLIQMIVIILLSIVGLPKSNSGMYWWMGVTFVDMIATHPVFYEEEEDNHGFSRRN